MNSNLISFISESFLTIIIIIIITIIIVIVLFFTLFDERRLSKLRKHITRLEISLTKFSVDFRAPDPEILTLPPIEGRDKEETHNSLFAEVRILLQKVKQKVNKNSLTIEKEARYYQKIVDKLNTILRKFPDTDLAQSLMKDETIGPVNLSKIEEKLRQLEEKVKEREVPSRTALDYYKKGLYNLAIKEFDKAIGLDPENAEAYFNRGETRLAQNKYEEARADYTEAIRLKQDDALAYHNRGVASERLGDPAAAIEDYTKAIQLKPDYAEAYSIRGLLNLALQQFDSALKDLDKAIQLKSNSAENYNNRGIAKFFMGQYEGALEDLKRAIQLNPDYTAAYKHIELVKQKLGRNE